uniref:Uncharacterized protein n=1 Tax=Arundo donax TaxID=35708 RepID=A0A0A9A5G3_ARUDO
MVTDSVQLHCNLWIK